MSRALGLIAASAITAITLAGCASTGSAPPQAEAGSPSAFGVDTSGIGPTGSVATDTPAAPPSSAPSCADQFASWRDGGGLSALEAVTKDLDTISTAASAAAGDMEGGSLNPDDQAALQQAAATLQSDTGTAQANLPPSCVPGLRKNVSAALTDYNRAAVEAGQSVTEADSGSLAVATSDLVAASKSMGAGTKKIAKATKAIKAYTGG